MSKTQSSIPSTSASTSTPSFPDIRRRRDSEQASLVSQLTSITFTDPSLTQQHMAADCDINTIIENFARTGQLTSENRNAPRYGDFEDIGDFHDSMNKVTLATELFMQQPAAIRTRFANDPANYVNFVLDEANRDEAIRLGLIQPASAEPVSPLLPQSKKGDSTGGGATKPPSASTNPLSGRSKADLMSAIDKIFEE